MTGAAAVLVCALTVLGRAESSFPTIRFVNEVPAGLASATAGFVHLGRDTIYLVTSSEAFRAASQDACRNDGAVRLLASILVHEEWHVRHGAGEEDAYLAQLMTLVRLGLGPRTSVYRSVRRTMLAVLRHDPRPSILATVGD